MTTEEQIPERLKSALEGLDPVLAALRKAALSGRDPTAADETLAFLLTWAKDKNSKRILEIGAGEGLTSCALLLSTEATVTAIELDADRAARARKNYAFFRVNDRVRLIEGDAGEILPLLDETFDFVFLDGPKVQYRRYFSEIKRLLSVGGVLFSDDVLFLEHDVPKKRRMLAEHLKEYREMLLADKEFDTVIYGYGEGLAVSVKKPTERK